MKTGVWRRPSRRSALALAGCSDLRPRGPSASAVVETGSARSRDQALRVDRHRSLVHRGAGRRPKIELRTRDSATIASPSSRVIGVGDGIDGDDLGGELRRTVLLARRARKTFGRRQQRHHPRAGGRPGRLDHGALCRPHTGRGAHAARGAGDHPARAGGQGDPAAGARQRHQADQLHGHHRRRRRRHGAAHSAQRQGRPAARRDRPAGGVRCRSTKSTSCCSAAAHRARAAAARHRRPARKHLHAAGRRGDAGARAADVPHLRRQPTSTPKSRSAPIAHVWRRRWSKTAGSPTIAPTRAACSCSATSSRPSSGRCGRTVRSARGDGRVPVVYRLDLTNPNSLFMEQRFQIANRDLIYVSNAPSVESEGDRNLQRLAVAGLLRAPRPPPRRRLRSSRRPCRAGGRPHGVTDVAATAGGWAATGAEPWLRCEAPPSAGRWLRLEYSSGLLDPLTRPVLRFVGRQRDPGRDLAGGDVRTRHLDRPAAGRRAAKLDFADARRRAGSHFASRAGDARAVAGARRIRRPGIGRAAKYLWGRVARLGHFARLQARRALGRDAARANTNTGGARACARSSRISTRGPDKPRRRRFRILAADAARRER